MLFRNLASSSSIGDQVIGTRLMIFGRPPLINSGVFEGSDDAGPFELRQFYLEDIEVNGTHVLFEEANDLAEAVADMLGLWDRFREEDPTSQEPEQVKRVRRMLAAYDERWEVRRG